MAVNEAGPPRPVPAVLAVVRRGAEVLLVRRANPPDAGLWGFPGGKLDWGETLAAATLRELAEETGVTARHAGLLRVLEVIDPPFHYVLIASRCLWLAGEPRPGDDALEARWCPVKDLAGRRDLSRDVASLAALAMAEAEPASPPTPGGSAG